MQKTVSPIMDLGRLIEAGKGQRPAAQEKRHHDASGGNHVGIFTHKKEPELQGAVLRVVPADELRFRFRQIERQTIGFSKGRDRKDENRYWLLENQPAVLGLIANHSAQIQIADKQ